MARRKSDLIPPALAALLVAALTYAAMQQISTDLDLSAVAIVDQGD